MEGYVQGALRKDLHMGPLERSHLHFASTWNNLSEHCISVDVLLIEGYAQGALRKGLLIDSFVERFETAILEKS